MITPQLTEQYGHVLRVSLAREIFRVWVWAWTGVRSNPRTETPTPPTRVLLRKVRRESSISRPPQLFVRWRTILTARERPNLRPKVGGILLPALTGVNRVVHPVSVAHDMSG